MLGNSPVNATLPCVDLEAARKFYSGTLGLTEVQFPGLTGEAAEVAAAEAEEHSWSSTPVLHQSRRTIRLPAGWLPTLTPLLQSCSKAA